MLQGIVHVADSITQTVIACEGAYGIKIWLHSIDVPSCNIISSDISWGVKARPTMYVPGDNELGLYIITNSLCLLDLSSNPENVIVYPSGHPTTINLKLGIE